MTLEINLVVKTYISICIFSIWAIIYFYTKIPLSFSQKMWTMLGIMNLPLIGGALARYVVRHEVNNWYPTLRKPPWHPPPLAFPHVWASLYAGMG